MVKQTGSFAEIRRQFGLEPMPLEGGFFRQTWKGDESSGRPAGTAILVALGRDYDQFSAMHRLPVDEVWHIHAGDPVELLLLDPETGKGEVRLLGDRFGAGEEPQIVVAAGVWMGGAAMGPIGWSLFSCTMAPGFITNGYEGGSADQLASEFPDTASHSKRLCRPGSPLRHPFEQGQV